MDYYSQNFALENILSSKDDELIQYSSWSGSSMGNICVCFLNFSSSVTFY